MGNECPKCGKKEGECKCSESKADEMCGKCGKKMAECKCAEAKAFDASKIQYKTVEQITHEVQTKVISESGRVIAETVKAVTNHVEMQLAKLTGKV